MKFLLKCALKFFWLSVWGLSALLLAGCVNDKPGADNSSYVIDGNTVTLEAGQAEQVRYFGNAASGDLDGDGMEDMAVLLTVDKGGSGTFYYVAAALAQAGGAYRGSNAIFLGDRIAPQSTVIHTGVITVNYAERPKGASFAEMPSINTSKYFKMVRGSLVRTYVIGEITHRKWQWRRTLMNDDTVITPQQVDVFTLVLRDDGRVMGTSDCNRFSGTYDASDNKLSFGNFAATRMFCEGSQEGDFLKMLGQVDRYFINQSGQLVLQIRYDSGSMIFE